jgi:hypothetical protein
MPSTIAQFLGLRYGIGWCFKLIGEVANTLESAIQKKCCC